MLISHRAELSQFCLLNYTTLTSLVCHPQTKKSQQGAFAANNANASGANDPDGSRRFNIFLARTVDPTGRPQIMGTIAPPQAGNLFPGERLLVWLSNFCQCGSLCFNLH